MDGENNPEDRTDGIRRIDSADAPFAITLPDQDKCDQRRVIPAKKVVGA
jgi:hypothetical protein